MTSYDIFYYMLMAWLFQSQVKRYQIKKCNLKKKKKSCIFASANEGSII